jgi:16S rRNA (cytosine1402-N4)-methyltransferase
MPSAEVVPVRQPPVHPVVARHVPVMMAEVTTALAPADGALIVDGTFGAGGYTASILDAAACRVMAIDRDPTAIAEGAALVARYAPRLALIEAPFGEMEAHVRAHPWLREGSDGPPRDGAPVDGPPVDGIVLDIGVSSMQLDRPERGFSFQHDGPLDMRMAATGLTAADVVATAEPEDLADILYTYGEERRSRAVARAIVAAREANPITRTSELAAIVARVLGREPDGRHPATRTFQALRIHVNDELGELERGLTAAERLLKPDGRLVVVTFHSLEDRVVKQRLTERTGRTPATSRHLPPSGAPPRAPSFRFVNRAPLSPGQPEVTANPRSRSARLRWAIRTDAPAWD